MAGIVVELLYFQVGPKFQLLKIMISNASGPPSETILVSAAHCNFVCKDPDEDFIYEICCCRSELNTASCRKVKQEMLK